MKFHSYRDLNCSNLQTHLNVVRNLISPLLEALQFLTQYLLTKRHFTDDRPSVSAILVVVSVGPVLVESVGHHAGIVFTVDGMSSNCNELLPEVSSILAGNSVELLNIEAITLVSTEEAK